MRLLRRCLLGFACCWGFRFAALWFRRLARSGGFLPGACGFMADLRFAVLFRFGEGAARDVVCGLAATAALTSRAGATTATCRFLPLPSTITARGVVSAALMLRVSILVPVAPELSPSERRYS